MSIQCPRGFLGAIGGNAIAVQLLVLLLIANGAPILLHRIMGPSLAMPVDGRLTLSDGNRLFGPSKTWRGLLGGTVAAEVGGWLLGIAPGQGAAAGALSLSGDLISSFVKRRRGIPASGRATGLDQIPEALLPTACLAPWFGLSVGSAAVVVVAFVALGITLSWAGFHIGLRRRPY